ncbi:hypothetical protein JAAARDRAFT_202392 [Jaapia argillacea MUCL 33604]|uniref:Pentacotripeptide-repeat region of PRORP domain-containing protein n=1 Tax=Jaapia argillacea MUCL 33604 TaxID=933084 RepID=A0A067QR40_9AGAM|nr:hypothetical protein JAAARDRAFT_202392 [Jaapia argillacea MUCL 33604]
MSKLLAISTRIFLRPTILARPRDVPLSCAFSTRSAHRRRTKLPRVEVVEKVVLKGDSQGSLHINHILAAINRRLNARDTEGAIECLYDRLQSKRFDPTLRHQTYERVIPLFWAHGELDGAKRIYDRLQVEGYRPSLVVQTQLIAYALVLRAKNEEELLRSMKDVFAIKEFDEATLRQLMRFMAEHTIYGLEFIHNLAIAYAEARRGSRVSRQTVKLFANLFQDADEVPSVLKTFSASIARTRGPINLAPSFERLLNQLSKVDPSNREAFNGVLSHMRKLGIEPNLGVFNALIRAETSTHHYDNAFVIYQYLRDAAESTQNTNLLPDSWTLGPLFRALIRYSMPRSSEQELQDAKWPQTLPHPRLIFRDMIQSHQIFTKSAIRQPSEALSTSLLNLALQSLMQVRDYAGAFIAVKSFSMCSIELDTETYEAVVKKLVSRIGKELASVGDTSRRRWTERFLGKHDPSGGAYLFSTTPEPVICRMILAIADQPKLSLQYLPPIDSRDLGLSRKIKRVDEGIAKLKSVFPSKALDADRQPEPWEHPCSSVREVSELLEFWWEDTTPLERLLKRAILADLDGDRLDALNPVKAVGNEITAAKKVMVPHFTAGSVWKMEKEAEYSRRKEKVRVKAASNSHAETEERRTCPVPEVRTEPPPSLEVMVGSPASSTQSTEDTGVRRSIKLRSAEDRTEPPSSHEVTDGTPASSARSNEDTGVRRSMECRSANELSNFAPRNQPTLMYG